MDEFLDEPVVEILDEPVETSKKAVSSFVLGLLSVVCSIFSGLPAIVLGIWALVEISNSQGRLRGKGYAIAGILIPVLLVFIILPLLLLPAVQAAREAAQRQQSMNNMKMITLGMMNFESTHRHFPPPNVPEGSQSGLSWRVHILPYIEETPLYEKFHLDEPWDSEHNRKLIAQMPEVFNSPGHDSQTGETIYQVPTGKEAMFQEGAEGPSFNSILDGLSNTIMLLEVDPEAAVVWTKPQDWNFNPSDPKRNLGGFRYGGICLAAFGDAHIESINVEEVSPEVLSEQFTPRGGEVIAEPF